MKKIISLLFMSLLALAPLSGCSDEDEPLEQDHIESIDVTYTYTVSEQMLEYFNITANYVNASGEAVGKHMTSSSVTFSTSADAIPAKRPIWFTVTRTDTPAPTSTPNWSTRLEIIVTKHYEPSGKTENSMRNVADSYSPLPDKFDDWAKSFISRMAVAQQVTVNATGSVEF